MNDDDKLVASVWDTVLDCLGKPMPDTGKECTFLNQKATELSQQLNTDSTLQTNLAHLLRANKLSMDATAQLLQANLHILGLSLTPEVTRKILAQVEHQT